MTETGNEVWYRIRKPFGYALILTLFAVFALLPLYSIVMAHGQMEAVSFLNGIVTAELTHHEEKDEWADNFTDIAFSGEKPDNYAFFLSPTEYLGDPGSLGLTIPLDFKQYGAPEPGLTDDGFIVVAIGNIDFDKSLDILWIDKNKKITEIYNDAGYVNNLKDILKRNW